MRLNKNTMSLIVTVVMILLLFLTTIPPSTAVFLDPGEPNKTSVSKGTIITFNDVNLTIRAGERIPVESLNFTISKDSTEVAHVKFYINGTEIEDPLSKFTVTSLANISKITYSSGGSYYGYDEYKEQNVTGFTYGYGNTSYHVYIKYTITYKTHMTGTFYAKLFVNASSYIYESGPSTLFTVFAPEGGVRRSPEEPEEEGREIIESSEETLDHIAELYDIELEDSICAEDTNGDGIVDKFTDPNGVLTTVAFVNISRNASFLISIDDDEIPEFFWDTNADIITTVNHELGAVKDTETDTEEETIIIFVNVNKSGWIYIETIDQYPPSRYPDYTLMVKNESGENISLDRIWRENGRIYVLDDPDTIYEFVYSYTLLDPIFVPASGKIFYVTKPTITITYQEQVDITTATFGTLDITDQIITTDDLTFTFTPKSDLADGTYLLSITSQDMDGNYLTSTATYKIQMTEEFPWFIIIILMIVIIVIVIIIALFKTGYLYIR